MAGGGRVHYHRKESSASNNETYLFIAAFALCAVAIWLWFVGRSPAQRRRRAAAAQGAAQQGGQGQQLDQRHGYRGWKILLNFAAVSDDMVLRPSEVDALLHLCSVCELYVFAQVERPEEEELIMSGCEGNKLIENGLKPHRVLFCRTAKGKEAFARQMVPALMIDEDAGLVSALAKHLPHVALISPSGVAQNVSPNVMVVPSVDALVRRLSGNKAGTTSGPSAAAISPPE